MVLAKFFLKLKNDKKLSLYIAVVFSVIALVIVFFSGQKTTKVAEDNLSYIEQMESKLIVVLEKIDGCGRVDVAISYKSNDQKVYAYQTTTDNKNGVVTQVSSIITVKGEPLVLKTLPPEIMGVVVVAEGANNPMVRVKIIQAVETLLGVSTNNIQVFTYKS